MADTKFNLILPICKVNEEARTVEGYATTEGVDKQNEMVDFAASKDAFKDWTGNIREMHEPKAVGKAIEWRPDEEKRGIYVVAKISKGAPDTWEKIKDGTLKAFSIGGQTVNKIQQIVKDNNTGAQKHITRITKYRLSELSLVDNPANPEATIELVKSMDGTPRQTQVVEELKKVLISEATDILEDEVNEHRGKADSLVKKVLSSDELEKLDSEHWGVIRKFEKDGKSFVERFLPMPDKVHAVRALAIIDKYNLSSEESERAHEIAKAVLGSDYDSYCSSTNRGGEIKKMSKEILDTLKAIGDRVAALESKVAKFDAEKPDSEIKTQTEGNIPQKTEEKAVDSKSEGEVPAEGEKQKLPDVDAKDKAETPVKTQEEGNVAPKKTDDKDAKGDTTGHVPAEGEKQSLPDVGAKDAKPELKTQVEGNVAPVKKSEGSEKSETKIEKAEESAILKGLQSLSKRLDALESAPMPRKYRKIEKRFADSEDTHVDTLAEDMNKAVELKKQERAGRKLTTEEQAFCENTLTKSLDVKFGKRL